MSAQALEEDAMPLFILMTKLAPESMHDAEGRRAMGKDWLSRVKQSCPDVRFHAHYALLGPYDFMDVYEAPDVETAHRVSLISRSSRSSRSRSAPRLQEGPAFHRVSRRRRSRRDRREPTRNTYNAMRTNPARNPQNM